MCLDVVYGRVSMCCVCWYLCNVRRMYVCVCVCVCACIHVLVCAFIGTAVEYGLKPVGSRRRRRRWWKRKKKVEEIVICSILMNA